MLSNFIKQNGVHYITEKKDTFSSIYIEVREKEERIYNDHTVKQLPWVSKDHKYYSEWKLRQKSTKRIIDHLINKNKPLKILDLGCGNGWFSNQLSKIPNAEVYAVDVNSIELEQAARVFKKHNLHFIYADIFKIQSIFDQQFNCIALNGSIQYFPNIDPLLSVLKSFLKPNGEINIIDSPFYKAAEIPAAKKRTKAYYSELGVSEMIESYHHHEENLLSDFNTLYSYKRNIIYKILGGKESPFSWYCYIKN